MFFEFGIKDIIDITLVALMLYYIYRLMKESRSLNVFIGIMMFVVLWLLVSQILEMRLLGSIMDKLVSVGVIGLIILFQEDIRKFLYNIGAHQRMRLLLRFFQQEKEEGGSGASRETIVPIVLACMNMSKRKVGALIVIERTTPLDDIADTGDKIDANINQRLIENIFFKNSPLHDGAMVISRQRIKAAGCILPVSHSLDIPKELTEEIAHAGDDKEAVYEIGTEWCARQCTDLIKNGVPAVHFYTMGKPRNITSIMKKCF